ncbi:MAG: hypothetical protein JW867_05480 [Candidatus Omnitrophica bacterium]|nr:hypothetical protein [Candidatus Omnitrophota bacterium]
MKKANAIIEYAVVLLIVVTFLMGINTFLRRHIEARVKDESDRTLGHAIGLEWPEQLYIVGGSSGEFDRYDEAGGAVSRSSRNQDWSLTYSQPIGQRIMKHKRASMHTQDAAKSPPTPNYPQLEHEDWYDKGWPKPD